MFYASGSLPLPPGDHKAEVSCLAANDSNAEVLGDTDPGPGDTQGVVFDDNELGWGLNLTGVINVLEKDVIRAGIVYGEGIASYMNDGGMDAGPDRAPGGPGVQIEAVELTGISAYYDHWWNDQYSSSIGDSFTDVDNTAGQTTDTYKTGQYASVNLLYYPVENVLIGGELLWGEREDLDGANNDDTRVQISVKYNFGTTL